VARTLAMLAASTLLAVFAMANPASATPTPHNWFDVATGRCLDSNYAGKVYTTTATACSSGNRYQLWLDWYDANTNFESTDYQTVRCLDSNSSGNVYTLPCNGGNYQKWYVTGNVLSGEWNIVNVATGRCLDSNAAGAVYTNPCGAGNRYQTWID
jgi:hypothetical protein